MDKKELVVKYRPLVALACKAHNCRNLLRIRKGKGNRIEAPCALLKKVSIHISGSGNRVIVQDFSVLQNTSISIYGDNNTILIGKWCRLVNADLYIEDSGNCIEIGEHTRILGKTHLAAIEGTRISVGRDCLFSSDVHFRTGDSHSILDMQGRRINSSEDIVLGNHVWVGTKVTCLKGTAVADHSIIGACALVTGKFTAPNCILAGVPAKVVKEGADWSLVRIPVGEVAADFVGKENG
ncbi:MAG: acyltransferase [Oscillospiraceae bacterium]|nr:acyltransferase [Oscillospiraceae bacterium]